MIEAVREEDDDALEDENDGILELPEEEEEDGHRPRGGRRRGRGKLLPRSARTSLKRLSRRVSHPTRVAWADWCAGMMIGLMPLMCHAILHVAARPPPDWDDNWAPDLLFISITNSGLVTVTVFTRMLGETYSIASMTPVMRVIWGATVVCFALASMLYGAAVTGMGNAMTSLTSAVFVLFSAWCSLTFELAVAREEEAAHARRVAAEEEEDEEE
jgi:hypothetical protein